MAMPARRLEEPRSRRPAPRKPRPRAAPARRPARGRAQRRVPFLLFSLIVTTAMVLLLVSVQALVAQSAFRMAELQRQSSVLEEEQARLRLEIAELSSPDRITRAARKAGLVLPDQIEILAVDTGAAERVASPSVPAGTLAEGAPGGEG
jgi:cell division protein FtsL